jgi:hypothetical protein
MELVLPVNFSAPFDGEQFSTGYIKYFDAEDEPQKGQFVLVAVMQYDFHGEVNSDHVDDVNTYNGQNYVGPSRILVYDVTNPRTANLALEIMLKNDPEDDNEDDETTFTQRGTYYTFKNTSIWVDDDGHTFLAANVQEKDGVLIDDKGTQTESDDIYTRVLIIDLTAALSKVRASGPPSSNVIIIGDATDRNSAYVRGASGTKFSDVYIGYIERDDDHFTREWTDPPPSYMDGTETIYYKKPVAGRRCQNHTMTCDQRSSVLSINPLDFSVTCDLVSGAITNEQKHGFVDLYLMNTIKGHTNFSSATAFVEPTRITTSDGKPICVDVVIGEDTYYTMPHEAHAHSMKVMEPQTDGVNSWEIPHETDFEENQIMLNVASFARTKENVDDSEPNEPLGGGIIFKVDWSGSVPGNATVTQEQYWGYGDDRSRADEKERKNYHSKTKFVLPTPLMDGTKPLSNK